MLIWKKMQKCKKLAVMHHILSGCPNLSTYHWIALRKK